MSNKDMRKAGMQCTTIWLMVFFMAMMPFAPVASAATPITFWTTEVGQDRQAVIKYLAQVFMTFNPDIEIRVEGIGENEIAASLAQARQRGAGPDIISCAADLIVSFSNTNWMDCQGTERTLSRIGKDRFYSNVLSRLQLADGVNCGIPFNGWIQGIWYRTDWFEEHNLAPPTTWDAIMKAARTLHKPEEGQYGILVGTRNDAYAEQVFTHLALSANVNEFSQDGHVAFNSPATVKTLEYYTELAKYAPPAPQTWRGRDYYLQGKLAMMFYSTFIMDDLAIPSIAADSLTGRNFEELKGAQYDYQLLSHTGMISSITGSQKASYGTLNALGLLQNGSIEREEAAEKFIEFLFTDEAYITWLHMVPGGMLPVIKTTSDNPTFFRDAPGVFNKYSRQRVDAITAGFESLKSFSFVNNTLLPQAAQVSAEGILPTMIQKALSHEMTPQQAVAEAAAKMQAIHNGN